MDGWKQDLRCGHGWLLYMLADSSFGGRTEPSGNHGFVASARVRIADSVFNYDSPFRWEGRKL